MPSFSEIATSVPWLFPSTFSLIGVLVGAGLALLTQQRMAKRTHRRELALSALEAVTKARGTVSAAQLRAGPTPVSSVPLYDAKAATEIWARFEMLAALEKRKEDYRALSASGMTTHEWLMGGAQTSDELDKLRSELHRLSVLLVAWERSKAKGRDFRLSAADAFARFGPDFTDADLPSIG